MVIAHRNMLRPADGPGVHRAISGAGLRPLCIIDAALHSPHFGSHFPLKKSHDATHHIDMNSSKLRPGHAYSYRDDPAVPAFADDQPIIIFDGHCALCSRFARFVLQQDRRARLRLLAAQSPLGQALMRHLNLDPVNFETNVLIECGRAYFKSDGTIRMFNHLGFPWSLCQVLRLAPRGLLDKLYDLVARNRLRWFGTLDQCFLADPAHRGRFLG